MAALWQVKAIFQSKLGDGSGASLDRQSYIEILQDIGVTLQEAKCLLQEYPEDSWIRVKDFLDIFFTSPEASLKDYFEKGYKKGLVFDHEDYQHDADDWCWVHTRLGVKVWQDILDLTRASDASGVQCVFHYTTELGFRNITDPRKTLVEVFASLITKGEKANAWWGQGVYSVQKPPDEWPDIEALIDNNYRNMLKRDIDLKGREAAVEEYRSRVGFCIPILVNASIAYDVSKRQTPEMAEQGKPVGVNLAGKLLNEDGMPPRQCIVVRAETVEEKVGNARAVLMDALRCRAKAIEERLGSEHSETLKVLSRLATVLAWRGCLAESERLQRRILASHATPATRLTRRGEEAEEAVEALTAMHALAETLKDAGKLTEAEMWSRKALMGCEALLGWRHAETLKSVNMLGLVLWQQGELGDAEVLFRRALEGRETQLGTMHPDTLRSINNLAVLLKNCGKLKEAEVLFWRALDGCERQLGAMHPETLTFVNNLAVLLEKQGKLEEAEPLFRRALEGREVPLGAMRPDTLTSVNNLAALLENQGRLEEAEPLYRRALEGFEAQLGAMHPETLTLANNLGLLLQNQGKLGEAEPLFRRALEGRETQLGFAGEAGQVRRG
ncbi:unnamed protein product [Durusdinium trenchii]|uniref:Kinesin light chain n=1 Tax=Durusdinium trenchii TaxID=1381693 RepID=A0ABP0MM96_9DINO